jgi:hypothetical protein
LGVELLDTAADSVEPLEIMLLDKFMSDSLNMGLVTGYDVLGFAVYVTGWEL